MSITTTPRATAVAAPRRRLGALALGLMLGISVSGPAFAGGANVWDADEIYSDHIALLDVDGNLIDINDDGFGDLVVASNRLGPAKRSRYYPGNGDGTFGAPVLLDEGAASQAIVADINNDTFPDLLLSRRDATTLLYLSDGAGDLDDAVPVSADEFRVLTMAVGDLDGDGDLDIVNGNGRLGGQVINPLQVNRFYINDIIGGGTLTFAGNDVSATDMDDTRAIEVADIDGDGLLDIIAGNDEQTDPGNLVYLNNGGAPGTFAAGESFGPTEDQTGKLLIGDLDGDGDLDIVVLNFTSNASSGINRYYINESNSGVVSLTQFDVSADTDNTAGGVMADFDGDGDLDVAVANLSSPNKLYLNQFEETGTVSFAAGIEISPDNHKTRELAAADINGDGFIDIIAGNEDQVDGVPGQDRRYLNNGTADPFTNLAPVIEEQANALETDEDVPLEIVLDDVTVEEDPDNVFPDDFTLIVQEGTNYTVEDNTITPAAGFAGELTVPVVVSDGTDESEPFELTVTVNNTVNTAPVFESTPVETATVDVLYTYNVEVTDPDTFDALEITEAAPLPAWLALTDNGDGTAVLTGTPAAGDLGDHAVSLQVTDGTETVPHDFTITVSEPIPGNTAPQFSSTPVETATEGAAYSYDITATDGNAGDTLVITAPTLPAWLDLDDNGDGTASLTGTPDDGDVGEHDVSLLVTDAGGLTATQDFTVTVAAVEPEPENNAPTFTSTAVTEADEGTTYTYDITATDADDGATLEITAEGLPGWLDLMDNGDGTATLTGTPAAADVGTHDISLEVSDGEATGTQEFTITVAAAPVTPPPPPPPSGGGGGGGSFGFLSLLALLAVNGAAWRRRRHLG